MIYVTGDIHGEHDIGKLNTENFPEQKSLSKDDFLLVCGDFGLVWDDSKQDMYWRRWLDNKPFTTIFVDGNHENFDLLYKIPTKEKYGCLVREIMPSIFHVDRGQVITLDNQKIFCMGGAVSHDMWLRQEHKSWWKEELPSFEEMTFAIDNLDRYNWNVDYVITHCAPKSIEYKIIPYKEGVDPIVSFHERVAKSLNFRHWYFGHYHIDEKINNKFTAIYRKISEIY